jgi:hypothetical protein
MIGKWKESDPREITFLSRSERYQFWGATSAIWAAATVVLSGAAVFARVSSIGLAALFDH